MEQPLLPGTTLTLCVSLLVVCVSLQVIERERSLEEKDGLRYYVEGTLDTLWEAWFHCYDLVVQLGPVIKR